MPCNSCSKSFSLLRQEKGCPGCGFSYCSKCLNHKVFLQKLNAEVKVCTKCKQQANKNDNEPTTVEPPDAYYRRIGIPTDSAKNKEVSSNTTDQLIYEKLKKLKGGNQENLTKVNNEDIIARLQKLKADIPSTSTTELEFRLANLKGVPTGAVQSKPLLPGPDLRTEQEQADDLMKQYMAQSNIDTKYKEEFDVLVNDIETRLQTLKGTSTSGQKKPAATEDNEKSDDEEEIIKKIIHRAKEQTSLEENEVCDSGLDELPFCEICNEDAKMRCRGCKYLFCKRCFYEHKDDDDGCDSYDPYTAPKTS
ncbi:abscission/NoCut checkpoint regulator isoform X1 [Vanessa atalanta]|uniref:abscission/NoCut checkpoint regulator isoform X1 n=1 Tax=Vanessa atalanta TaxID=42275 RepID=UPI001FCCDADF|nr:abscission/NoCut checkpoint regulator isoform X1 [Vanessa atalanta]